MIVLMGQAHCHVCGGRIGEGGLNGGDGGGRFPIKAKVDNHESESQSEV